MIETLTTSFSDREALVEYVRKLAPHAQGAVSDYRGGHHQAQKLLSKIDPVRYGKNRNYGNGHVTRLSAYIHHGIIDLNEVRNVALSMSKQIEPITSFIQELAWRDFWQRVAENHPQWLWHDIEEYKTGFKAQDYSDSLPDDIKNASTKVACIDAFIKELLDTGYLHNHARMYLASYIVHFRKVKWQAGAQWFLEHLLDGDEASNNFSWQWVASTFSNKPYIFNLENVQKYFGQIVDTHPERNKVLHASYEALTKILFPFKRD